MTLYCQGCDYSFTDQPVNAAPQFSRCPDCGGVHWATWKRGEGPPILDLSRMTPAFNAGVTAPCAVTQPNGGFVNLTFSGGTP